MKKIVTRFRSTKTLLIFATILNVLGFGLLAILPLDHFFFVAIAFIMIAFGFVIVNANTIHIGVKYLPKELVGLGSGTCLMIRWLGGALGGAISGSVLYALPRHYLSKHINELPAQALSQIKEVIQGGMISIDRVNSPAAKAMLHDSMSFGIHFCMLIICALYLINLVYSMTILKK